MGSGGFRKGVGVHPRPLKDKACMSFGLAYTAVREESGEGEDSFAPPFQN